MANEDMMKMLSSRREEVAGFIDAANSERQSMVDHLQKLDEDIRNAERDHRRLTRALKALDGAEESDMKAAVNELIPAEFGVPENRPMAGRSYMPDSAGMRPHE